MGYVFQAFPSDLLNAEVPQLSPVERGGAPQDRLINVFLATLYAVPAMRHTLLKAVGFGSGLGGRVEIYRQVRFRGERVQDESGLPPPDGLMRRRGAPRSGVLIDAGSTFDAGDKNEVQRIASHLALLRERRLQRLVTVSGTVPSYAFLSAVNTELGGPGIERLRSITWMDTVDEALHLLERKTVESTVGVYLLEQYIRFVKEETVRDLQARSERPQGALFFTSLGADWNDFVGELKAGGTVDPKDPRLPIIATNWLAFVRFLALHMTRGAMRDEDALMTPSVKANDLKSRRDHVIKRLRTSGQLLATFRRRGEELPTAMCLDLRHGEIVLQHQLPGPKDGPGVGGDHVRQLAESISDEKTLGTTRIKIYWPSEKQPREITRLQAFKEPVTTAPPRHGLLPDKFVVERKVPCQAILAESQSLVQLLTLELRGFRAATRHLLHTGGPA